MTTQRLDTPDSCVPNIGTHERRMRLIAGAVAFGIALVLAALLLWTGAGRLWRLMLLPLLCVAGLGFFQHREKT